MPAPNVNLTEQAKLKWLRAAAKEGFDAIELGDYVSLNSEKELKDFLRDIREEAPTNRPSAPSV